MVAWTGLQSPWKYHSVSDEQKAQALSDELPPPPDGMDLETLKEYVWIYRIANRYGYDPETDYRE